MSHFLTDLRCGSYNTLALPCVMFVYAIESMPFLHDLILSLQTKTVRGRTGQNGHIVHSDVMSVRELELESV